MDELLDDRLTPRRKRVLAKTAPKAGDARDANALHLGRVAVEHGHTRLGEDMGDLRLLARFAIVVAENRHDRDPNCAQFAREDLGLFRQTVVGQIAREEQHIRCVANRCEQWLESTT